MDQQVVAVVEEDDDDDQGGGGGDGSFTVAVAKNDSPVAATVSEITDVAHVAEKNGRVDMDKSAVDAYKDIQVQ